MTRRRLVLASTALLLAALGGCSTPPLIVHSRENVVPPVCGERAKAVLFRAADDVIAHADERQLEVQRAVHADCVITSGMGHAYDIEITAPSSDVLRQLSSDFSARGWEPDRHGVNDPSVLGYIHSLGGRPFDLWVTVAHNPVRKAVTVALWIQ